MSTSNCGTQALSIFAFGPVVEEGLGLGYIIKDNSIHVNVTSFKKESNEFVRVLRDCLIEIQQLIITQQKAKL